MAKKKKSRRKQLLRQAHKKKLRYGEAATKKETASKSTKPADLTRRKPSQEKPLAKTIDQEIRADAKDYSYVKKDLTRIGLIVLVLAGVVIILWLVLSTTDLGVQLYRSIKI